MVDRHTWFAPTKAARSGDRPRSKAVGGNVARSAGLRDLGAVMRQADEYAVLSPQQRREATLRHIHRNDPPGPRSPELIARMSERSVYDLREYGWMYSAETVALS
jgi:hypothetical protein